MSKASASAWISWQAAAGVLDVARGQHDLESGRQQPGALKPIGGGEEEPADGCGRGVRSSLGQPQQGQAGLRLVSQLARVPIGLVGLCRLAPQAMDLGLLVERRTGRPADGLPGPLARPARLGQRLGPRSVELHDLRAMHQADARERHHLGLLLAPSRQRERPFARATGLVDLAAGLDHAAVHQPRHDGRELTRDHREHRLVEELQPGRHLALLDGGAALHVSRGRGQIGVVAALPDRRRFARGFPGRGGLDPRGAAGWRRPPAGSRAPRSRGPAPAGGRARSRRSTGPGLPGRGS